MHRPTRIQVDYNDDINEVVQRWGDHENMSAARVIRWLEQFDDDCLNLALQVVRNVTYYGAANIRSMTRQLFQITVEELRLRNLERVAFIPVGEAGSGSAPVARVLRELTRGTNYRVLSMLELSRKEPGSFDALVFVDDFSGTGHTLIDWWENVEPLVRPMNASVFVSLLVLNGKAREEIESFTEGVFSVTEFDEDSNIFSEASRIFSEQEKAQILEHCKRTGCSPRFERGFGECGLLIAFKHGCPNNSIPVLWYESQSWRSLFNRRAI
jgi:hypothetical protein